eukprot:Tamp_30384.p2 GENE.Tamp_30384~~Tamp_30384.p2  ORF type:complete len:144 (+),score=22.24 Tamp_30384:55-432(+)
MLEALAGGDLGGQVAAAAAFYPTRVGDVAAVRRGLVEANAPLLVIQGDEDDISRPELAADLGCTRVDCAAPIPAHMRYASLVMQGHGHGFAHRGDPDSYSDEVETAASTALDSVVDWILRFCSSA